MSTLKLKKMPNIAEHLHYVCQNRGDHLYIKISQVKKKMQDEFEIPFDEWPQYFTGISRSERTAQDFKDDEEVEKDFAVIRAEEKSIEKQLRKHGEECSKFKLFMEYAYHSFPHKDGNGFISLTPLIRDFDSCPYCGSDFTNDLEI